MIQNMQFWVHMHRLGQNNRLTRYVIVMLAHWIDFNLTDKYSLIEHSGCIEILIKAEINACI